MADHIATAIRTVRAERDSGRVQHWIAQQQARLAAEGPVRRCLVRRFAAESAHRPGLLQGVALAHKDVFDLPGHAPGAGRTPRESKAPRAFAAPLARLYAAGALNLGSLTLAELCCGATGENRAFGRALNPVDPQAVVGGSSSGSAVAVAAGLCTASLGTDTAGSVRIPAATCGVVGLKPTHGAVDSRGVFGLAPSLDTVGVLARSASDAAHVWTVLAAPGDEPVPAHRSDAIEFALEAPQPWRLALALDGEDVDENVGSVLQVAARELSVHWRISTRTVADRARLNAFAQVVLHVEAATGHLHEMQEGVDGLPDAARAVLLPGLAVPATWYAGALGARGAAHEAFLRGPLREADVLVTPASDRPVPDWDEVTPGSARHDPRQLLALNAHFAYVNYLGLPAVVFPVGSDRRGRPVSIQAIARAGSEPALLAFAHQAMRALGTRAPAVTEEDFP
ncbi:amidase [Variovorax defluvii]|uniref:Amidase n=1 Tax=Variovorax defluvii TaxID=913761 RepID=A0ABP8IH50_9BURK